MQAHFNASTFEAGLLWRIQAVDSGNYVRAGRGTMVAASPTFFSLFEIEQTGRAQPTFLVREHRSSRTLQVGEQGHNMRLSLTPPSKPRRRYLHWFVNHPPIPPPPIPPPPPPSTAIESHQIFHLEPRPPGTVFALYAAGGESARPKPTREHSGWFAVGGNSHGRNTLFRLQRVASLVQPPPPSPSVDASAPPSGHGSPTLLRAIHRVAVRVGGESVVMATAYMAKGQLDVANLFWAWLSASGVRGSLLLSDDVACEGARAINASTARWAHCISPRDLHLPHQVLHHSWARRDVPHFETDANTAESRFLQRCKLRLIATVLHHGYSLAFVDVGVLVLNSRHLHAMVSASADLMVATDPQSGFHDHNPGRCLRVAPANSQLTSDWVDPGQLFVRPTAAGKWFIREAEALMDGHVISDGDAIQALLTGHAQVSDPLRAQRSASSQHAAAPRRYAWLKPFWLEADNEPFTTTGGSVLARSRWIRPLNAPLDADTWQRVLRDRARLSFSWQPLPDDAFLVLRQPEAWASTLRRAIARVGPGVTGAAAGVEPLSVRLSCHVIDWLDEHRELPAVKQLLRLPHVG